MPVRGLVLTSHGIRLSIFHPSNISLTDLSVHYSWSIFYSLVMTHGAQNKEYRSPPDKCSDKSLLSIKGKIRKPIWHRKCLKQMCQNHLSITRFVHKLLLVAAKAEDQIIPDSIELWEYSN